MALPPPTFQFTIPSVHDGTVLNCRLYVPSDDRAIESEGLNKAVILAHPYAPLGGNYDNPVIEGIGKALLSRGYVVGSFNFRGAPGSAGHTSWSGKPELGDYVSLYGFMLNYLKDLAVKWSDLADLNASQHSTGASVAENEHAGQDPPIRLILGGYSYGSMQARKLPSLENVMAIFRDPAENSPEAEILQRASHLSTLTTKNSRRKSSVNRDQATLKGSISFDKEPSLPTSPILMGGSHSDAVKPRTSKETRRSLDIRRSIDHVRHKVLSKRHSVKNSNHQRDEAIESGWDVQICYLLISPIQPPLSSVLTSFTHLSFRGLPENDADCPVLAVCGNKDGFISIEKFRVWALSEKSKSTAFRHCEIDGAGHFWQESGVLKELVKEIQAWTAAL